MENEKRVLEAKIKLVIDKENDSKSAIDSSNEQNLQLQREREDLTKLVKVHKTNTQIIQHIYIRHY